LYLKVVGRAVETLLQLNITDLSFSSEFAELQLVLVTVPVGVSGIGPDDGHVLLWSERDLQKDP